MRARTKRYLQFAMICSIIIIVAGIIIHTKLQEQGITMNELKEDFVQHEGGGGYFLSYDDGDNVKIEDTISNIEVTQPSANQTYIWFESIGNDSSGWMLVFQENLTDEYKIGDEVIVTLHIVEFEMDGKIYEAWPELYSDDINHA